jgi:hypothetical protein
VKAVFRWWHQWQFDPVVWKSQRSSSVTLAACHIRTTPLTTFTSSLRA